MDSITQGVLGAAIGEAILGKKNGNKGALVGAIVATIPDLDVLLFLFYDKLDMLSIHRGFSHSILCGILGAFLIAFVLNRTKWFATISFKRNLLFVWLCLFTHTLLDTFTAYGTQLFLPFSNQRVGFDSINVVDPLYTVPLIVGLVLSLWIYRQSDKRAVFNYYGLIISSAYLLLTLFNKQQVEATISAKFAEQNITYQSLLTMPVGIANLNWYGVAKGRDSLYMLHYSMLEDKDYSIEAFPINESYLNLVDSTMAETMRWFAKGFYTVEKSKEGIRIYNLQVDMRGTIMAGGKKAPTAGYFEIKTTAGKSEFSSGTVGQ